MTICGEIGAACADLPLVTAGSGLAVGLPQNFRSRGCWPAMRRAGTLPGTGGLRAVIAGSCSTATQQQVALMRERHPTFHIDPLALSQSGDRRRGRARLGGIAHRQRSRSWSTPPPGRKR